jgi:membrane-bound metal-dependent hydrolase YbcI (DUF457 family)
LPNYKGHLFGGTIVFFVSLLGFHRFNPTRLTMLEWYFFCLLGSLFPDVDTKSKGQKLFYQLLMVVMVWFFAQQKLHAIAFVAFLAFFPLVAKHRGFTHSISFLILLFGAIVTYSYCQCYAYLPIILFDLCYFFLGAVSHILLDKGIRKTFLRT